MNSMQINNISVKAISISVPDKIESHDDLSSIFGHIDTKKISDTIGIYSRRIAEEGITALDLMYDAVTKLLNSERLDISEIDCLVCISQTPDYIIPGNSFVLCNKLNAKKEIFTLDINSGCSGFTHGMITIAKLMENSNMKYGLLVTGDTISKLVDPIDQATRFVFGDAASACLIEHNECSEIMTAVWKTIAKDYDKIIMTSGGMRAHSISGNNSDKSGNGLYMNGIDVFSFSIKEVPILVNEILQICKFEVKDIDLFVFHQANKFIVEYIRKKLKISEEKNVINVDNVGNTSSTSIPLALCLEAKNNKKEVICGKFCFTGFGVGLSVSSIITTIREANFYI